MSLPRQTMMSATTILASDFGTLFTASCRCLIGSSPAGIGEGGRVREGEGNGGEEKFDSKCALLCPSHFCDTYILSFAESLQYCTYPSQLCALFLVYRLLFGLRRHFTAPYSTYYNIICHVLTFEDLFTVQR